MEDSFRFYILLKSVLETIIKDHLREFETLRDFVPRTKLTLVRLYNGTAVFIVKDYKRHSRSFMDIKDVYGLLIKRDNLRETTYE
jgi:hypothetical protein